MCLCMDLFRPCVADMCGNLHRDSIESARENTDGSVDVCELTGNNYVGAEVLRGGDRKYLSTVTATGKTKCWMLQASCVKHAIGSSWNE